MPENLLRDFVEELVRAVEAGTPPTGKSDEKALKVEFDLTIPPSVLGRVDEIIQ